MYLSHERDYRMSFDNLNKFIGKTLISDSLREAAMGGQLAELLQEFNVDEGEIGEVLDAHPESLQDLYTYVAQMQARQDNTALAGALVSVSEYEVGLPVDDYPTY